MSHISTQEEPSGPLTAPLLNTAEAAALIRVSKRTFQELVATGKVGFCKFGRNIRFSSSDIEAFIEAHRSFPVGWKNSNQNRAKV